METVYVLGAGFSMPFLPDQSHLLTEFFQFDMRDPSSTPDMEFFAAQGTLRTWFEEQFGDQYWAVWLEDVFTWLDHMGDADSLTEDVRRIHSLRRQLYFALAYYFIRAPQRASTTMRRRLAAMQGRSSLKALVTLNWDTLLERTGRRFDYGVPAYDLGGNRLSGRRISLLKLHGSAHWWMCAKCKSIMCDDTLQASIQSQCPICNKDQTQFDPILMTPTLVKNPAQGSLAEVWRLAFVQLSRADEIVFMGYSLPQADHALFHLIRQAIHPDACVRAVLVEKDRTSVAGHRFRTLMPRVQLDFSGIDGFLGIDSL